MFDRNNDGFIKRDELRSILNKLGQAITEEELCEMIEKADADRDGKIDIKGKISSGTKNKKKMFSIYLFLRFTKP